jgi:hypothetical protein
MQYNDFIIKIDKQARSAFEEIAAEHNFEYGAEFEIAICKLLRRVLPSKYGICRGYVVSKSGEIAGDDIIIFNQERFPTLRGINEDFAKKEQIPIEAVYAYIEAKHKLNESSLKKAVSQIREVKKLISERPKIPINPITQSFGSNFPGIKENGAKVYPNYGNPVFTMVWSKFSEGDKKSTEGKDVVNMVGSILDQFDKTKEEFAPDMVVAGETSYTIPALFPKKKHEGEILSFIPAPYYLPSKGIDHLIVHSEILNFGLALAQLLWAIDWIELGHINYQSIVLDTISKSFDDLLRDKPNNEG